MFTSTFGEPPSKCSFLLEFCELTLKILSVIYKRSCLFFRCFEFDAKTFIPNPNIEIP